MVRFGLAIFFVILLMTGSSCKMLKDAKKGGEFEIVKDLEDEQKLLIQGKGYIIAKINGNPITTADINYYYTQVITPDDRANLKATEYPEMTLINRYIDELLLYEEAKKRNYKLSFQRREEYHRGLAYAIIEKDFSPNYNDKISNKLTEENIKRYYEEEYLPTIYRPSLLRVIHLLTKDKKKAMTLFNKIKKEIEEKKLNLEVLEEEFEKEEVEGGDRGKLEFKNGDWGYLSLGEAKERMSEPIYKVFETMHQMAVELKDRFTPFLYPEAVETKDGVHLFFVTAFIPEEKPTLSEAKESVKVQLYERLREEALNDYAFNVLGKKYKIEIDEKLWNEIQPVLETVYKSLEEDQKSLQMIHGMECLRRGTSGECQKYISPPSPEKLPPPSKESLSAEEKK